MAGGCAVGCNKGANGSRPLGMFVPSCVSAVCYAEMEQMAVANDVQYLALTSAAVQSWSIRPESFERRSTSKLQLLSLISATVLKSADILDILETRRILA